MLKLENALVEDHQPLNAPVEPCWIGSEEESKFHFDSLTKTLHEWYIFMVRQVIAISRSPDVSYRIRRSGKHV